MTRQTGDNGKKNVEIMVLLKYLSNFWKTIEMPSINYEIMLILTWDKIVLLFLLTLLIKMQHLK